MRTVLFLRGVQRDLNGLFLARNVQLLSVGLILLVDHLKLYRAFRNGRKMSDAFLIGFQFPVNAFMPAELCIIAGTQEIEDHGGVFDGFFELVLDDNLDRRSRRIGCRRQGQDQPGEDSRQRNSELHASIIAQLALHDARH